MKFKYLLFYIYLGLIIIDWIFGLPLIIKNGQIGIGLLFFVRYVLSDRKNILLYIIFFLPLFLMVVLNIIVIGTLDGVFVILKVLSLIGLTFYLIYNKLNYKVILFLFLLLNVYFAFSILMNRNPNEILLSSQNGVSALNLFFVSILYLSLYQNKKKVYILPTIIVVTTSIWASGRSGIISALILLCILILCSNKFNKFIKAGFIVGSFLLLINSESLGQVANQYRFDQGFISHDPRMDILRLYISNLSLKEFIFGIDWRTFGYYFESGNLHNSFLQLHARTGVFIIIFFLMLINTLQTYLRKNLLFFGLLVALSIRVTSDTIVFFSDMDFILFYLILYPYIAGERNKGSTPITMNLKKTNWLVSNRMIKMKQ